MPWVKIDKDKPLDPGDIVELDFKIAGGLWLSSTQIAMIEWQLSNRDDWEIINNSLPAAGRITFTVQIKDQAQGSWMQAPSVSSNIVFSGAAVTAMTIAASIIAASLVMSLMFYEARMFIKEIPKVIGEIAETTTGKIALSGMSAAGIALLIFVVYKYVLGK